MQSIMLLNIERLDENECVLWLFCNALGVDKITVFSSVEYMYLVFIGEADRELRFSVFVNLKHTIPHYLF